MSIGAEQTQSSKNLRGFNGGRLEPLPPPHSGYASGDMGDSLFETVRPNKHHVFFHSLRFTWQKPAYHIVLGGALNSTHSLTS